MFTTFFLEKEYQRWGLIEMTTDQTKTQFVLVPERLTAENGAKAALAGEFFELENYTLDEDGVEGSRRIQISWNSIKEIYNAAINHFIISGISRPAAPVTDDAWREAVDRLVESADYLISGLMVVSRNRLITDLDERGVAYNYAVGKIAALQPRKEQE
jgi:hypothetical protein